MAMKRKLFYTVLLLLFALTSCQDGDMSKEIYYNNSYDYEQDGVNSENELKTVHGSLDIPLADDLEVNDDNVINFDSFNGNIISITYTTKVDITKIKNFYLKTLPQIGWEVVANEFLDNSDIVYFKRDKETLEIEFTKSEDEESEKLVKFFGKLDN